MKEGYSDIYKELSMVHLPRESWREIKGDETMYQVSNMGRIKSFVTNRILKQGFAGNKQLQVVLCGNRVERRMYVSMIVGATFVGKCGRSRKEVYCHLNRVKTDNRACNIAIMTKSDDRIVACRWRQLYAGNTRSKRMRLQSNSKYYYIRACSDGSEERYTSGELAGRFGSGQRSIVRCVQCEKHFLTAYKMRWRRELICERNNCCYENS